MKNILSYRRALTLYAVALTLTSIGMPVIYDSSPATVLGILA